MSKVLLQVFSYTPDSLGKISQNWKIFLNPACGKKKHEGEESIGWLWGGQFTVYFHLFSSLQALYIKIVMNMNK